MDPYFERQYAAVANDLGPNGNRIDGLMWKAGVSSPPVIVIENVSARPSPGQTQPQFVLSRGGTKDGFQ